MTARGLSAALALLCSFAATARAAPPPAAPVPAPEAPFQPGVHGWIGGDVSAGICTRPELQHPCYSRGLIPEVGAVLVATAELDPRFALEWRLVLSVGLSDSIRSAEVHPLRTLLGAMGEFGARWLVAGDFYLALGVRAGLQIATDDFVTNYIDPITHLVATQHVTGAADARLGGALGVGWLLGGDHRLDLSFRATADTGTAGVRASLTYRLD